MADEVRMIDANKLERQLIEGDGHDDDRFTEGYNFAINEVRGYIADMPTIEVQPDNGWISVDDRLPEPKTIVLVHNTDGQIYTVIYLDNYLQFITGFTVTHWQHLPKPPKGE